MTSKRSSMRRWLRFVCSDRRPFPHRPTVAPFANFATTTEDNPASTAKAAEAYAGRPGNMSSWALPTRGVMIAAMRNNAAKAKHAQAQYRWIVRINGGADSFAVE